jgi:hypothetical protein
MFGRKQTVPLPSPPSPPPTEAPAEWAMQVLTTKYIVEGTITPLETRLVGYLNIPTQITVTLHNVKLLALGAQAVTMRDTLPEVTLPKASIIGLIPRDAAGTRSTILQVPERAERAVIHVGPYLIRGAFRMPGGMPLSNLFNAGGGDMLVLTDAEVKCQLLGARFTTIKADVMVLNKSQVYLYHPDVGE